MVMVVGALGSCKTAEVGRGTIETLFDDIEDSGTTMLAVKYTAVGWLHQQFLQISRIGPKNIFDTLTAILSSMATARLNTK